LHDLTAAVPLLYILRNASWLQTVRFYVNETRRSYASFNDVVDEDIWIIYNDKIVFSGRHIHEDVSCHMTVM
jgi:hypothetical protein